MTNRVYNLKHDQVDTRDYLFSSLLNIHPDVKLPTKIDLRPNCPQIYDQGQEGSCTANAGVAARVMLSKKADLLLSRQFLYRKERELEGTVTEDSGASMRDICDALYKFGVCEEQLMPYIEENLFDVPSTEAITNAAKYKVKSYSRVNNIDEIKQSLALKQQPVLLGMTVFESMETESVAKSGVLPMPKTDEQQLGGHAVLVVGYCDTNGLEILKGELTEIEEKVSDFFGKKKPAPKPAPTPKGIGYLILRNSWGEDWGQKGYFLMPYDYVNKGYAYDFWSLN